MEETMMSGRYAAISALLGALLAMPAAQAQLPSPRIDPRLERRATLDELLIETLRVETQLQAWTLRKVCLDGQAYWVGFGETTPTGIAPAYKDGKPEACKSRSR
jgi:hypothetical protein